MISVFNYQQYREFLKDYYEKEKSQKAGFTYARFSAKAGVKSPNYLKLVMDGNKNLTPANIIRFSKAIPLSEQESDYFEALVHFNQAKNSLEREYYQDRMRRFKMRSKGNESKERTLEEYEFESISNWLHHAVLVMTNLQGFRENPIWIKNRLFDLATESEIASTLERLIELKLLSRNKDGRLIQTHRQVTTQPELRRLSARIFYEGLLARAIQALKVSDSDKREYSTYFVGISSHQLPELKKRVREFMKSLNEFALANAKPHQVYAFTFAGFPLTNNEEKNPYEMP